MMMSAATAGMVGFTLFQNMAIVWREGNSGVVSIVVIPAGNIVFKFEVVNLLSPAIRSLRSCIVLCPCCTLKY